jgi:type II secretory pathway component PulF
MQRVRLLTKADVELIETSARVGNRPWALEQLATRKRRRVQRRLEFIGEFIQPAAILLLGVVVLTFCWTSFAPIVSLILSLT